ncbi:MFS general substrate transporter [Mollisia scopiformis]|uniref:MFS general substrate transporter n=1 Tax=Mollisia scopiformis TaxID=149040 RepID=A0A132B8W9_MOLSC|nr:MFS general substrate transporter [Mollisia scopiformis]KUJ08846.1 MFS general substrate transporter [Mollisia scopiformis]
MQSYLAYKRFGKNARDQYERDRKRAEALSRGNAENDVQAQGEPLGQRQSSIYSSHTEIPSPPGDQSPDTRDPEKGEQPSEDGGEIDHAPTMETIHTTHSFGTRMGHAMTGIEVRELSKEMTRRRTRASGRTNADDKQPEREKVFVVGYESETDPMDPHNWSYTTRILATIMIAWIGFIVGFASAVDSAALTQAAKEFGVAEVTESLATGLFLVGFGFGALFAGPISETVGRNPVYIVTLAIYMIWIMASALAPNIGAQLVFRFLAGFFGSTPLTCAGGSISDLWNPMERVYAFPVFANAAFMGPIFGPVVGGFVGQSTLVSWRWCEWITLIISGAILALILLFQPETFAPILLYWKASHLRKITGDSRYVAEVEIRADPFFTRLLHALYRPFLLTIREPIVVLFALYLTIVYIILFTFLDGYTYIFGDTYGFSEGITGLAFLGIAIGLCGASVLVPLIHHWAKRDLAALQAAHGPSAKLPPEKRLWFAMFGAPAVPISLFWMGWTNYPSISYWSGLLASVLFGYGILCIFISSYQYIIDSYEMYAASALASLTLIRYVAAGCMVEVGIPFYENLGVHWTLTILGAISALMVPVPYAFYRYGPKIRSWSKYAQNNNEE